MAQAVPEPQPLAVTYEWPPTPVLDVDEAATILSERLQGAWQDLEAERLRVLDGLGTNSQLTADRIAGFLSEIEVFMQQVDYEVREYLRLHLQPRYEAGMAVANPQGTVSWTLAHRRALTSLAVDTYEDFLSRAQEAGRISEAFASAVRVAAGQEIPKIAAGGVTAVDAGDQLAARLVGEYQIETVVYRDGSRVPVRHWARMAARTKSAVAFNAGSLNEWHGYGVTHVEVFDGPGCGWTGHSDGDAADGKVVTLAAAAAHVISHPNCVRSFGARPDVSL